MSQLYNADDPAGRTQNAVARPLSHYYSTQHDPQHPPRQQSVHPQFAGRGSGIKEAFFNDIGRLREGMNYAAPVVGSAAMVVPFLNGISDWTKVAVMGAAGAMGALQ
jgi:hypothetical protein